MGVSIHLPAQLFGIAAKGAIGRAVTLPDWDDQHHTSTDPRLLTVIRFFTDAAHVPVGSIVESYARYILSSFWMRSSCKYCRGSGETAFFGLREDEGILWCDTRQVGAL